MRGLKDLPKGGYYELLLTKDGKPGADAAARSGRTTAATEITLNAPYPLRQLERLDRRRALAGRRARAVPS